MNYQIEIAPAANKELKKLPGYVRAQAIAMIDELANDPHPARAKELRDKPTIYRIWLARKWRIVYRIRDDLQVVRVLRVRLKEDIDYDSLETSE